MASPLLTRIFTTSPLRIINNGFIIWNKLKTEQAEITVDSQMSDNPFATSNLATIDKVSLSSQEDLLTSKIVMPATLKATMICDDVSTLLGIISLFYDITHQVDIISKEIYLQNMAITDLNFDQLSTCLSATRVQINFEQTKIVEANEYNAAQDGDQSSFGVRIIPSNSAADSVQQLYNKIRKTIEA